MQIQSALEEVPQSLTELQSSREKILKRKSELDGEKAVIAAEEEKEAQKEKKTQEQNQNMDRLAKTIMSMLEVLKAAIEEQKKAQAGLMKIVDGMSGDRTITMKLPSGGTATAKVSMN